MGHKDSSVVVELDTTGQEVTGTQTMVRGILAAFFYGMCSVSSAFVTKTLLDTLEFDFPVTIMVSQMVFTIVVLEVSSIFKVIALPSYNLKRGLSFLWPSLFYAANSVLALSALSHMNIAMYGVLKRCVPLSTMLLSSVVLRQEWPSRCTIAAVCTLSVGCVIAVYGDLSFSLVAYGCGIASNFTQTLYLLLVQRFTQHHHMSTMETLHLNCINAFPILLAAAALNGELASLNAYPASAHPYFPPAFLATISVGMLLNYSLFLCTGLTSALTTSVVGGLKAMVQTLLGLVTFGGVSHNIPTYLGIALNLTGGMGYIAVKYQESHKRLHKVMSFSVLSGKGSAPLFDGKGSGNGFVPPVSDDSLEGSTVKERSHGDSSGGQ